MPPVTKKPVAAPKKLILQKEVLRSLYAGDVAQVIFTVGCSKKALSCGANSPCMPQVKALIRDLQRVAKEFEKKLPDDDKKTLRALRKGAKAK
jgi:hypothetical protein